MRSLKRVGEGRISQGAVLPSGDAVSLGERFHRGEVAALAEVWREHFAAIHGFLRQKYAFTADIEQITVDAFWRAWEHHGDYHPGKPLRPWLRTIADHLAASLCRSPQMRDPLFKSTVGFNELADLADPRSAEDDELFDLVHESLGAIPARYAELLWANACEESGRVHSGELAAERGVTAAVIDQWIHRAKALLRKELLNRGVKNFQRPVRKTLPNAYSLIDGEVDAQNGQQ